MNKFVALSGPDVRLADAMSATTASTHMRSSIDAALQTSAHMLSIVVESLYFDSEVAMVQCLQDLPTETAGIVINTGSLGIDNTLLLRKALESVHIPCAAVCLGNGDRQDESQHQSTVASACIGVVSGFGIPGYGLALEALCHLNCAVEHGVCTKI